MHSNYLQAFESTHDSRTFVLTVGPNPHSGGSRAGQWGPFSKGLLLQSWKATAINRMYSSDLTAFGKKCCFFFPFWCLVFDMFWCCTVLDLVISTYFNHVNGAKCLIHNKFVYWVRSLPFSLFMYLKEKQYKIAMVLLCPVQGPWASSLFYRLNLVIFRSTKMCQKESLTLSFTVN